MKDAGFLDALERLAEKYRVLADLRARREEAEAEGMSAFAPAEIEERTARFRRVAREFPGALRELDVTPAEILRVKARAVEEELQALRNAPRRESTRQDWMAIVIDYHATLREALAVKLWLAQRLPRGRSITPDLLEEFGRWHAAYPHRHGLIDQADASFLEKHRRPPGGRLHALVWGALSARYGIPQKDLEAAVFGPAL